MSQHKINAGLVSAKKRLRRNFFFHSKWHTQTPNAMHQWEYCISSSRLSICKKRLMGSCTFWWLYTAVVKYTIDWLTDWFVQERGVNLSTLCPSFFGDVSQVFKVEEKTWTFIVGMWCAKRWIGIFGDWWKEGMPSRTF